MAPPDMKVQGPLAFATRIHLGHAVSPPSSEELASTVAGFLSWAERCGADVAAIAVDSARKIDGYDLPSEVRAAAARQRSERDGTRAAVPCDVVPVAPWQAFVPALNALVAWAAGKRAGHLLLASAETTLEEGSVRALLCHVDRDTLVAGCALPGHDYRPGDGGVALGGRTTPWNTCAVWNLAKLALTGFPLVAEGLHPLPDGTDGPSGVEEASAIAVLQRVLPEGTAVAKLVGLPGASWDVDWTDDERRAWHERKMKSKVERAGRHLELLGLEGKGRVTHI